MSHVMHFHFPPAPDATCENTSKAIDKVLRNIFLHALTLMRAPVHSDSAGIVIYIIQDGPKAQTMHAGKTLSEIPTIKYPIKVQFDIKSLACTLELSHVLFSMKLPSGFPLRFISYFSYTMASLVFHQRLCWPDGSFATSDLWNVKWGVIERKRESSFRSNLFH